MTRIKLEAWNRELAKSVIYRLERQFAGVKFTAHESDQTIRAEAADGAVVPSEAQLQEEIHELLGGVLKMASRVKSQVVDSFRSERSDQHSGISLSEGEIRKTAVPGSYWLGLGPQKMMALLDELFLGFARKLGAAPISTPALISQADLVKCGYLPKELHQVSFLGCRVNLDGPLESESVCLSPATCLTTYPVLRGSLFDRNVAFTVLGTAFRRECGRFSDARPLERLWEYRLRELIFFGDSRLKEEIQAEYFRFVGSLGRRLDLSFEICSASDLFFHPEQGARAIHQLMTKTKFEFNFLGLDWTMALSSFNAHGLQFVQAFNIQGSTSDFQSFCIGFGLQRWVQALLSSYGGVEQALAILEEATNDKSWR